VNTLILEQFKMGQAKLLSGKCVEAVPIKRRIVQLMSVPLVQGSLRYAYKVDKLSGGSKEKAEGEAARKKLRVRPSLRRSCRLSLPAMSTPPS